MGQDLSCFEWNNLSSEHLDGSLLPGMKKRADSHMDSCAECRDRAQHYRLILESLRALPRVSTPSEVQHALEEQAPRIAPLTGGSLSNLWNTALKTPYRQLRSNPRALSVVIAIAAGLFLLGALPKIRSLYEAKTQKRLDASNFAEMPLTSPSGIPTDDPAEAGFDDFAGEDDEVAEGGAVTNIDWSGSENSQPPETATPQKPREAHVWRFLLRTDSPQELRPKVHLALVEANASPQSKLPHGFQAPGGIQFDVFVPQGNIETLRESLSALIPGRNHNGAGPINNQHVQGETPDLTQDPYPTSPFTWYRNRSKRPLPPGYSRVIVWLPIQ